MASRGAGLVMVLLLTVACGGGGGGGGGAQATPEPAKSSLVMALVPSNQAQAVLTNAQPIADYIAKEVGVPVTAQVPTSYAAVVEGMTSNNVDIAWVGALAYVAAHQKSGAEAITRSARCAPTYTAAPPPAGCAPVPTYPSIIVCNIGSGVGELKDGGDWSAMKGKRFAFGDGISTSSNLWPRFYMKKNGIDPDKDFSKTASISSQSAIVLAVYNGTADCGGMFGDARTTALKTAPDVMSKTKVVFIAPQEIPGDPQVVRHNLNPGQKTKVKQAMIKLGADPAMKKALDALYQIASMEPAKDSDYDPVRRVVAAVNPNIIGEVIPTPIASPSK
jgi:phosphonate transport system substrate-binding protein